MKRRPPAPTSRVRNCVAPMICIAFAAMMMSPVGWAQQRISIRSNWSCTYHGSDLPDDVYTFDSDQQARSAVARIVGYTGLVANFEVRAADVPNAAAVLHQENGRIKRLLLYSQTFIQSVTGAARTDWAATSIMAHEIGHHLQGHTLESEGSRPDIELQADSYSGFVLQRMGATLSEAQIAISLVASEDGSPTHPPKRSRLAAIASGWTSAREQALRSVPVPRTPTIPQPAPRRDTSSDATASASWFVVASKVGNRPQQYFTASASEVPNTIKRVWDEGYNVTQVGWSAGTFMVVGTKKVPGLQRYLVYPTWPADLVKQHWDDGYRITSTAYGNDLWVVIMSKGIDVTAQVYQRQPTWPDQWVRARMGEGFSMTQVSRGKGEWLVVMSKGTAISAQTYTRAGDLPRQWIDSQWNSGPYITSAAYAEGEGWVVVMSKVRGYSNQAWQWADTLPKEWIDSRWKAGYDLTLVR